MLLIKNLLLNFRIAVSLLKSNCGTSLKLIHCYNFINKNVGEKFKSDLNYFKYFSF